MLSSEPLTAQEGKGQVGRRPLSPPRLPVSSYLSLGLNETQGTEFSACSFACWRGRQSIYQDPRTLSLPTPNK